MKTQNQSICTLIFAILYTLFYDVFFQCSTTKSIVDILYNILELKMHLHLENFDGPLDLLLHLIKVQEINIFNIPIFTITEQFLTLLKQVPNLDYHAAGEYLATAAQLIEIKANSLLPVLNKKEQIEANSLEDLPDTDPRKPLVEALLEYEAIKNAAEFLSSRYLLTKEVYPSREHKRREEEFQQFEHPIKGNAFDLVIAFEKVLLKYASQKPPPKVTVKAQKITIQQKMISIRSLLEKKEELTLVELMADCLTRYELIVTLMAMLELCKARHVLARQEAHLGPIFLSRGDRFSENDFDFDNI